MTSSIRIAVVDDHPLLRDGVVHTLKLTDDIEVVGVGSSAAEAVCIASELFPEIMLVDISMPGNGIEVTRRLAREYPQMKIIILTVSEREEDVHGAIKAGARGYILKGITGSDLLHTIRAVSRGETYITPQLAVQLLTQMKQPVTEKPELQVDVLTAREEQILEEVSIGLTNKEIARKLDISEKTVKHYMTIVLHKLQARNRVEAALAHMKHHDRNGRDEKLRAQQM